MFDLLIGLTAAISAQTVPAAAPARSLAAVPGISVKYYDLVGKNDKALRKLLEQRPKDAAGYPLVATKEWTIGAKVQKRTENGVCKIVGADPSFQAVAEVPRLVNPDALKGAEKANWQAFVAQAEADTAADLWAVHDNLGQVRTALLASSCEGTAAAIDTVSKRLMALDAQSQQRRAAAVAAKAAALATESAREQNKNKDRQRSVAPAYNPN
jgi:predicted secreted Zn-dependent protease